MATTYLSPGVYVEEQDKGVKPIEAVGASMAAFVGITADASSKAINPFTNELEPVESRLNKATLITSWLQYNKVFGGFVDGAYTPDAVYAHFMNGGGACYITSIRAMNSVDNAVSASAEVASGSGKAAFTLTAKSAGDAGNNLVATVTNDVDDKGKATGTFSLTLGGETVKGLSMKKSDDNYVGKADLVAATVSDAGTAAPADGSYPFAGGGIAPLSAKEFIGDVNERTGIQGLEAIDAIRIIAVPDLMAGYDGSDEAKEKIRAVQAGLIAHCEKVRYAFGILDTPPGLNAQQVKAWREWTNYDTSYAAMYYPWVRVADQSDNPQTTRVVPPSGHMVGVYNRVDSDRGVHKAPANEVLRGAVDVELLLTRGEQDTLNPIGVNCIRTFTGRGIRAWGARTLSSNASWRYINVRRLFILIEASMDTGLQWVVFEPNNEDLWARVRRDVTAFLRTMWMSGAFFGNSPDQAFYVKVDAELNPSEIRDLGQLIIEVGVSPVKPAEFVIFRISQWAGADGGGDDGGE